MKAGRIVAVVIGVLVLLPTLGLLIGGSVLTVAHVVEREDAGYFNVTLDRLSSATAAILMSSSSNSLSDYIKANCNCSTSLRSA